MKIKRIFAYLIDLLIVSVISTLIFSLPIFKQDYKNYEVATNEYLSEIRESGSGEVNEQKLLDLQYNTYKESATLLIIKTGLLIIYFGVFGYFMHGQTIGKKIFNIKIVSNSNKSINPALFILREILVTNFIPELLSLIFLLISSKNLWTQASLYISYASYITAFLLVGFMIFRDDERGLHDLICDTKVINVKNTQKEK